MNTGIKLTNPVRGLSIAQQVLLLLAMAIIVAQAINIFIVANLPPPPRPMIRMGDVAQRMDVLLPRLEAAEPHKRKAILDRASDKTVRFSMSPDEPHMRPEDKLGGIFAKRIARRLEVGADEVRVRTRMRNTLVRVVLEDAPPIRDETIDAAEMFGSTMVAVRLDDGQWVTARAPRRPEDRIWLNHVGLWFLVSTILLAPIALLFARRLASPIGRFAGAADRLGRDPDAPLLAEEGPRELRAAARAFNTMQDRIRRFVADRTLMLAAISHDLRTPLQRLRFRVDGLPDEQRRAVLADIEEMEAMLSSTLAFARDDAKRTPREALDLGALVGSVCDDAVDAGEQAACTVDGRIVVTADPIGLKRAVQNLVTNAIKYGGAAEVRVAREDGHVLIEVADRGPGIPEDLMEEVFQPFRRLEPSRSRATGGAGLGLAIARTIARGHGGDVTLAARPGGGLLAKLSLPA